ISTPVFAYFHFIVISSFIIFFLYFFFFFFFTDPAPTEIYTLSLHDALPIFQGAGVIPENQRTVGRLGKCLLRELESFFVVPFLRSEEHTSELQSQSNLVCRLLLEKKKKKKKNK